MDETAGIAQRKKKRLLIADEPYLHDESSSSSVSSNSAVNEMLPEEIVVYLFSFLGVRDLCQAAAVCQHWNRIAQDSTLWLPFMHLHWNEEAVSLMESQRIVDEHDASTTRQTSLKLAYAEKFKGKSVYVSFLPPKLCSPEHMNYIRCYNRKRTTFVQSLCYTRAKHWKGCLASTLPASCACHHGDAVCAPPLGAEA